MKRIAHITLSAFIDEMDKIKEAGAMKDIGDGALGLGKAVVNNARNTFTAFKNPIKSLGSGLSQADGFWGKASVGMGAAMTAPEAFSKEDPTGEGRSRVERSASWVGDQVGGLIGAAPHAGVWGQIGGSLIGGMVGRTAGKLTGKAVDAVRGYKSPTVGVPNEG